MIIESPSMQVGNGRLLRDTVSLTNVPHRIALGIGTAEALESQFPDAEVLNAGWVRMMHGLADNLKAAAYTPPQVQLTIAEGAAIKREILLPHPRTRGDSMNKLHTALALAILSASLSGNVAVAQDHHDNHAYVEHKEWKKGAPIKHEDWDRGDKVDYRQNHLKAPPSGYEWRMVDGNYVLANSSTFQIRTVVRIP